MNKPFQAAKTKPAASAAAVAAAAGFIVGALVTWKGEDEDIPRGLVSFVLLVIYFLSVCFVLGIIYFSAFMPV